MTEEEWRTCSEPGKMLTAISASNRKGRLFLCECVRRARVDDELISQVLRMAELFADGEATLPERVEPLVALNAKPEGTWSPLCDLLIESENSDWVSEGANQAVILIGYNSVSGQVAAEAKRQEVVKNEQASQADVLRDIVPFRPITLDPSWLTSTVLALAQQMYDSRDFSAMPILADALQDAGCDNPQILEHCRGPGPHVRGCFIVDACLGKV